MLTLGLKSQRQVQGQGQGLKSQGQGQGQGPRTTSLQKNYLWAVLYFFKVQV